MTSTVWSAIATVQVSNCRAPPKSVLRDVPQSLARVVAVCEADQPPTTNMSSHAFWLYRRNIIMTLPAFAQRPTPLNCWEFCKGLQIRTVVWQD